MDAMTVIKDLGNQIANYTIEIAVLRAQLAEALAKTPPEAEGEEQEDKKDD